MTTNHTHPHPDPDWYGLTFDDAPAGAVPLPLAAPPVLGDWFEPDTEPG
ncbi:MAG TPA: hypothetical protein VL179_08405 [Mycobacterium sp.]|nr:hypothetical protein [Mycobacterium sp.]